MKDHYTRRDFLKKSYRLTIGGFLASSFGYTYARYIEPKQLDINSFTLKSSKIPKSFDGIRILQFSDTHIGHYYDREQFANLIQTINEQKADIVIFTGDLIDAPDQYKEAGLLVPLLKSIKAPLGKFSVYGNHDHGGYGTETYRQLMEHSGFKLLMNSFERITLRKKQIVIAGLDDYMLGRPDFEQTLGGISDDIYTIFLAHEPDVVKISQSYPIEVQLSGHSHGGQIKLPIYGALITPPFATEYIEGFYKIGSEPLTLYVNRGLGTTRVPFRFLSKPELTIFTLETE